MKKKLLAMLLAVVMVCGVAGCGKDKTDATDGQQVTAELDGEMKKEADTLQKALEGYAADLTAEDAAAAGCIPFITARLWAVRKTGMLLPQAKRMKLSFASSPKMTAQCWIP